MFLLRSCRGRKKYYEGLCFFSRVQSRSTLKVMRIGAAADTQSDWQTGRMHGRERVGVQK